MTPSVQKTIRELFTDDFDGVLNDLMRFGRGLGHARSCVVYEAVLRNSNGDRKRITALIDWALSDEVAFRKYLGRWQSWIDHAHRLADGTFADGYLISPVVRQVAVTAAEYACSVLNSHNTLCLYPEEQDPIHFQLLIVPITGGSVFITCDVRAAEYGKQVSIADECPGTLVADDTAVERILSHIEREFVHDCVGPTNRYF